MNKQEELILEEIKKFYQQNKLMPSVRYLQKVFKYQSPNAIFYYLKSLEKQLYLKRNTRGNLVLNDDLILQYKNYKRIKIVNSKNQYISLILNKRKKYLAFILKNNYFINDGLLKNDILIIERSNSIRNNELGLFIVNDKFCIMKYYNHNNFYILKDKKEIITYKINLIGKVVWIERKIKRP